MHNEQLSRRESARQIWQAGVEAVQPRTCVPACLSSLSAAMQNWSATRHYLLIGGGKAGAAMGRATVDFLLGQGISAPRIRGWLNVPECTDITDSEWVHLHPARQPGINFPTPQAVAGTLEILDILDRAADDALVLCLISGGGSALVVAPVPDVPLEDKVLVSRQLSEAGASIQQLNAVRKHLSQVEGGGLAKRCFESGKHRRQLLSLIISDVIGDPLDVIASGPTAPDPTTFAQALEVLHELGVASRAPESVMRYLHAGRDGKMSETLKSSPRPEPGLMNRVIANNRLALDAAGARARHLGYEVVDLGDKLAGDTLELAKQFAARFEDWRKQAPVCVLSGGETTVRLPSAHGKGGRNQSMALALMESLGPAGLKAATILCGGTDGEDGPTDAAGAFADDMVRDESAQLGLNPSQALFQHDAYPFFEATGGLFRTGLTNTNVMDLRVFLIG